MEDLPQISESGNRLETLKALRQKVAEAISKSKSGRDIAALSRQLQIIMVEIEEIEGATQNDEISKILAEREASGLSGVVRRKNGVPLYATEKNTKNNL